MKFSTAGNFLSVGKLQNTSTVYHFLFLLPSLFTNHIYASTVIPISPEMNGNDFFRYVLKKHHDYKAKTFVEDSYSTAYPENQDGAWCTHRKNMVHLLLLYYLDSGHSVFCPLPFSTITIETNKCL